MRVVSIIACEFANLMPDGRFNVLAGGISRIFSTAYPTNTKLALVMQIQAEAGEVGMGPHALSIRLMDEDGKDVLPVIKTEMRFDPGRRDHSMVVDMGYLKIRRPGRYGFSVLIGGREEAHWSIEAIKIEATPSKAKP